MIKIGGSLAVHPNQLRSLMEKLGDFSKKKPIVIIPGGGEFADKVRDLDKRFSLKNTVSHRMAILAMDQFGLLLSDLTINTVLNYNYEHAKEASLLGKLSIFLPSQVMFAEDPLENSWKVTSDSIAFYIAYNIKAEKVIFVTDVDGIYPKDPKYQKDVSLILKTSPDELIDLGIRTSVDSNLPHLIQKWPIDCIVVNGLYPDRVEAILEGKQTVSTYINSGKTR